ncbi:MAG: hypothetical protein ABW065_11630 [Solirubrobacterales bacterium]
MTETKAFFLVGLATALMMVAAALTLRAFGVDDYGVSVGMIFAMVLGAFAMGWVAVHYGDFDQKR